MLHMRRNSWFWSDNRGPGNRIFIMLFSLIENPDHSWSLLIRELKKITKIDFPDWDTAVRECNKAMRIRFDKGQI